MTDETLQKLALSLDDLGRRIAVRIADFRDRGEFSDVHAAFFEGIDARRVALGREVAAASNHGEAGEVLRRETVRDVEALIGDFESMLFNTAAGEMRSHRGE